MLALMTVRYRFVSRRLCKHATAGVWVKQCRVYTISTCATWGQINNPGFLARDATKRVGAQWWDSKQIQINPSRIDLGFILPSKGIREKTGECEGIGDPIETGQDCTWKLSVASGSRNLFTFFPQCLAGKSQNKNKMTLTSKSRIMLLKWGCYYCALVKTARWKPVSFE